MNKFEQATIEGHGVNVETGQVMMLSSLMELYGIDVGYRAFMSAMGEPVTDKQPISVPIKSMTHFKDLVNELVRRQIDAS